MQRTNENGAKMVQGPSLEVLEAIRNPSSLRQQITSLKQLKNDIVGHDQRKELVVRHGVVEPLVNILSSAGKSNGKRKDTRGSAVVSSVSTWTEEDEARLQATLILGSLGSGGRAFVHPLLAAGTVKCLLDALAAETASRVRTASLQALRSLAWAASSGDDHPREQLSLVIFTQHSIGPFHALVNDTAFSSAAWRQQLKLIADIIALSATHDATRSTLVQGGMLDALAAILASHAIAKKHITYSGPASNIPPPFPPTTIPSILSAITAIVTGSNFRVQCFILAPALRKLFSPSSPHKAADPRDTFSGLATSNYQSPTEALLPPLHLPAYKSVSFHNVTSSAFPALGSLQPSLDRKSLAGLDPLARQGGDAEHATAVVGYLLFLARSMTALGRLHALRLLALVNNAIEADSLLVPTRSESFQRARERERQIALLAIPLAVKLVQTASEGKNGVEISSPSPAGERENAEVKEQACEVLAVLIQSSKELQIAAVDAGAIKKVCPILKKSFDNVAVTKPMWSASRSSSATDQSSAEIPESSKLGHRGLPPEIQHAMRCRQSSLEALAALAKREDIHRKAIVEAGVVGCIIDSLRPFPPDFFNEAAAANKTGRWSSNDGNTIPVILAACHAAQSMSRSVSLLRTSLIDAGIAKPIFELLKHANPVVQVAATDVCCNLLLEFSPMRDDLLSQGVVRTLTEHARQSEMGLRLSSLWALKHLVLSASREVKISCLEELGTGWLVNAIQGEQSQNVPVTGGGVSVAGGLSTPNAAGEQVDLLNPASTSMDVDDPPAHLDEDDDAEDIEEDEEEEEEDEDEDGEVMYDEASATHYQASQLRSTLHRSGEAAFTQPAAAFSPTKYLTIVREIEQDPALKAKRDDVAVQEQALDFVRNLLNGEDCAFMLDLLLEQVGVEKVFSLLADKLAPVASPTSINHLGGAGGLHQPTDLILATIHVLTHIAASHPKHKSLLIAHPVLLRNWLPHFNHADRRVRVISVWAVNSLTWIEDEGDRGGARQRARELRLCGIEGRVRGLGEDGDLDVRERVRTAVRQMEGL